MVNSIIKNAVLNTKNGRQVILTLDNGTTKWYAEAYVRSVLTGADMEGARITSVIGTPVSYETHTYKKGDKFVDDKGIVVTGRLAGIYENDGKKLVNFTFGAVEGFTTDYDRAKMVANATSAALMGIKASFTKPKLVLEEESEASLVLDSSDAI